MMTPFENSTSVYIQDIRGSDHLTLFVPRSVAASSPGTKESWEHNRLPRGEVMATWGVACCSWLRRLLPSIHPGRNQGATASPSAAEKMSPRTPRLAQHHRAKGGKPQRLNQRRNKLEARS